MIYNNNNIDIVVEGKRVDIIDTKSLNIRLNNVLFNPEEISTTQAEYSFSFDLPTSPTNCEIFGHANVLSVKNKFNKQFKTKVYANEILIFDGMLKLSSISKDVFKCNLVSIKLNKVDDIFGDTKMNELKWYIDYNGIDTINSTNENMKSEYFFPLVCYGAFQKTPSEVYSNAYNAYTPKHTIDKFNKWYYESFSPSINLLSLVQRLFKYKGYEVDGDIFNDENIKNVYLSEYLKDGQSTTYNIGREEFGKVNVRFDFSNADKETALIQELIYPKEECKWTDLEKTDVKYYNLEKVYNYDVFTSKSMTFKNKPNDYLFRENMIVVPSDGLYKISMDINIDISKSTDLEVYEWLLKKSSTISEPDFEKTIKTKSFDNFPIEVQLVRNEDKTELIYGNPTNRLRGVYPHEGEATPIKMIKRGEPLAFDPLVNPNFLCGFTTINQSPSFIKNGRSWSVDSLESNVSRYNMGGYWVSDNDPRNPTNSSTLTSYNKNSLQGVEVDHLSKIGEYKYQGHLQFVVALKKNDTLRLKAISKCFQTNGLEAEEAKFTDCTFSIDGELMVEAYTPKVKTYQDNVDLGWDNIPQKDRFETQLNLGQFLNAEEKMSDFVNDVIDSLNLQYIQNGKNITLNKTILNGNSYIDLDDRIDPTEAEIERIEYPSSMEIKYKIDDEERGFYMSVPNDKIELDDWKDYADVGSEKLELVEDAEDETIELKHSYTWYEEFTIEDHNIQLPIISKDEYMIEGYDYEESMKHDGKSLSQRWWYRNVNSQFQLKLWNNSIYNVSIPTNEKNGNVLNYKNENGSLLKNYFNIFSNVYSNKVQINVYITPQEYIKLKNGTMVKFDEDLYVVSQIEGYDPSGNNTTKITLLK